MASVDLRVANPNTHGLQFRVFFHSAYYEDLGASEAWGTDPNKVWVYLRQSVLFGRDIGPYYKAVVSAY